MDRHRSSARWSAVALIWGHWGSLIATEGLRRHHCLMGRESTQQTTPDLFSTDKVREAFAGSLTSGSGRAERIPSTSQRHVLPENLDHAIKQLNDDELMQLIEVALKEAQHRGKSPLGPGIGLSQQSRHERMTKNHPAIEKASSQKLVEVTEVTLSPGKLNAVRAAFKAGISPSRIARQFGISQANVRKALASDDRKP